MLFRSLILNAGVDEANKFEDALRNSTGTAENMASTMNDNLNGDLTALNSQIEGVQIAIYEKFEPALRAGVDALSGLTSGVQWLVDHGSEVSAVITGIATAVGTYVAYTTAMKVMQEGWTALTIVTKAQTIAQTALNAVMSANPIGLVIALIAGLVTAFVVLWNKSEAFRNFWIGLWNTIKSVAEPVVTGLVTWFSDAWTKIKGVWNSVGAFFSGVFNNIKNIFDKAPAYFMQKFTEAWNAIKGVFSQFGSFFSGLWNTISSTFSALGTRIGDAIGGAVKAGINGVISSIENTINSAINLINGAINLINKIPAVNIGKLSRLSFPRLAKGGVVNSATIAEIGEAGAEAVVPLENNLGWVTRVAELLAKSLIVPLANVTRNVNSANSNNNSYNETVEAFKDALGQMKIVLDDEEIGDFVEKTVADAIYT